jgi:hypothetical protein
LDVKDVLEDRVVSISAPKNKSSRYGSDMFLRNVGLLSTDYTAF